MIPAGYRDRIGPWMAKREILHGMGVAPEDIVVFDIGAYKGDYTAMYQRMWPEAEYHLFEPVAEPAEALRERFAGQPKVHVNTVAVADKTYEELQTLHVGGQGTEMTSLLKRAEGRRYYRHELEPLPEATEVICLDDYVRAAKIKSVHLIKMDTQGAEGLILEGAKYVLKYKKPLMLYMEVFFVPMYEGTPMLWELMAALDKFHYSLFDIYNGGRSKVNRQLKFADVMFVSQEVREQVLDKYPEEWLPKSLSEAMGMRKV